MTKISQYSTDVNITGNDKWIGSDAQNFLITKNFTPNNLANYFNENNVIDIGTSIRYRYQTLLPGEAREQGTISFETEIGPQVNFSAITTFLIAKNTLKGNTVTQYLDFLVDGKVLLSKASNINIFGYYKITSIEPWIPNTNFFVVEVDFLAGNGFIYEDLDYLVSLVDKAQYSTTPNLQEVTDVGSITTNTITVGSLSGDFSQVLSTAIGTQNYTAGTYAYLDSSGYLGLNNGTVESYLKNTNVTNVGVILEFPNKPTGSYTIATTDDVPTASTLQEVTDEGNTTTNDIQLIDDAEVIFGAGGGILLDNGSRLREGTIDAGLGGSKGIAQICAVGYELKWEAGRLYVMNGNGNAIRSSLYNFNIVPTINDDDTKAYYVGSLWSLDNGDVYECTDSTTGAAVWELKNTGSTPTLQQVTDEGNITTNDIIVEGANDFVGQISSQVLTAYNNVTGAYAEMFVGTNGQLSLSDGTSTGILSVNNLDNANVQLEFPDKLTGTYTIATTSDIPTLTSQLTNDVPFLTQDNVVEYPDLASFPVTGVIGTIYIALDTEDFYLWDGVVYVLTTPPNTGITGVGTTNYLPRFTSPTTIGNSKISQDNSGAAVFIRYAGRPIINGNTFFSIQRAQTQMDFVLGNPGFSQPSIIISDNQTDGFEIHSKGELAIKTGATYSNEGLRVLSTGKLKFTQTPDTGTTSDKLLVRDTSGNVKQIDYPTGGGIPHATATGTDTYTATITGVTSYADGDAYLIRFTNGNTTGATLNINSLGAITLYRNNDGVLIGGDITSGGEMICVYNSTTSGFQCIGTAPNSLFSYVTNADSVTLTKGMPVYAFGGTGDRMTVKRAYNTGDSTSAQTVGLVLSTSIATNQKGLIMMQGLLDGLSILPTSTWADGDTVYLGATAGTITNVKPYAPNHLVYLGVVTTSSNGAAGRMYVRVQNGYELDELHNVQAQSPSLKETLWYDNTVSPAQWKTASISTVLGFTPENVANKENTTLDTSTTKYPTNRLTKEYADAKVTDAITNGVTTIAPSQNAVFDALALKADAYPNYPFNTTTNYFGLFDIVPTISTSVVIGSTANNTNSAVAFNRFSVDKEITISDFAILQNAANDGASATVTLYIFDDSNSGLPGIKLHQETTATGILTPAQKYISFTNNITLQKGNYWIALHFRGLNTAGTNPSFIGGLVNQPNIVTSIATYGINFRPLITGATADLSNNPTITLGAVQNLPQIFIKI